ncbi:aldo/keto reductase [Anaerolineales bacterium]
MKFRRLGNSDLEISVIGLGTWAIGGVDGAWTWGEQDDQASIDTIRYALDSGMNWIDTAPVYGLGHSEEVVGRALKGLSEKPLIFTKCSFTWDKDRAVSVSLAADTIRREVEDSLRRLQVEIIDLYQIHWPNPEPQIEEGWETLAALKKEGKVRYIGLSNFDVPQMERMQNIAPITSLQPPYSAVKTGIEAEILPYCAAHNIGVIAYSPMQAGLLTGKMSADYIDSLHERDWRRRDPEFQAPRLAKNLKIADEMQKIAAELNVPTPVIPVAWVLRRPEVTGAIVGARRPDQVDGFIQAGDLELSDDHLQRLDALIQN